PEDETATCRRLVASGNVDAMFLAYMRENDPRIAMLKSLKTPFVVHGRSIGIATDYPFLDIDNTGAFYDAARLLTQLGHRHFALINGPEHLAFAIRREKGTMRALSEQGLVLRPECVHHSQMTDEYGFRAMERFLQLDTPPTAVLCSSTVLALGAVRAINQAGLKLGADISLIA